MLCRTCYLSPKLSLEAYAYCEAHSLISCVPYLPRMLCYCLLCTVAIQTLCPVQVMYESAQLR